MVLGIGARPSWVHLWICSLAGGAASRLTAKPIWGASVYLGTLRALSAAWWGEEIILSAHDGDAASLWAGVVDGANHRLKGELRRITVGSGNEVMPSISANGRMLFASWTESANIWEVNPARTATTLRPLTTDRARNLR